MPLKQAVSADADLLDRFEIVTNSEAELTDIVEALTLFALEVSQSTTAGTTSPAAAEN